MPPSRRCLEPRLVWEAAKSGAEIHRSTREGFLFGGGPMNTRVGEPAAMRVLGTTAAERRHREVSGVERHEKLEHVAVRGSADTVERRFGGTSRTPRSHTMVRGAGWLRCGDLAMPGVREAEASAYIGRPTVTASSR
jgi:hypothetical protein